MKQATNSHNIIGKSREETEAKEESIHQTKTNLEISSWTSNYHKLRCLDVTVKNSEEVCPCYPNTAAPGYSNIAETRGRKNLKKIYLKMIEVLKEGVFQNQWSQFSHKRTQTNRMNREI